MRLSVDRFDPGFHPEALLLDIRIVYNGKVIRNCITADSDAGEVVVHGEIIGGNLIGERIGDGEWPVRTYSGTVQIIENGTERQL